MTGLLDVAGLSVEFATSRGVFRAVDDVGLQVDPGEVLCVVGESGSGKSVTMLATMGLLDGGRQRACGPRMVLRYGGIDLQRDLSSGAHRSLLGRDIAMVFQEPMSSLNPCFPVGWQIAETLRTRTAPCRVGSGRRG